MSDVTSLAGRVGDLVGGPENVSWVGSCTTRLRFIVKDEAKVDFARLNETAGVLQAVNAGGQVQVVIGTHVDDVRKDLLRLRGWGGFADEQPGGADGAGGKRSVLDAIFDFLGGTFQPLIPVMTGAALVQVVLLLLQQFAGLDPKSPTALVLSAAGNAVFYFLPVFVAFTASRKLGANPFVGAAIAAALLHPSFVEIGKIGDIAQAFGLPLFVYSYSSSMFPALLIALALAGLDRVLKRFVPQALQQVLNPTVELLLLVPLTALVFGPIGVVVGNAIGTAVTWMSTTAPFLFYILVPAFWVFLVALGIHWAVISIAIGELAATGTSVILGAAFGYQYAIMGVALAMFIKVSMQRRDKALRDVTAAATLAVAIGGITEPTIYGLLLRYRRLLVIEMIAAAVSGAVLGMFSTLLGGFAPAPILALPLMKPVIGGVLGMAVAVVVSIVLVQIWGYEKRGTVAAADGTTAGEAAGGFRGSSDAAAIQDLTVVAPIAGSIVPLAEAGEPVFAGGLIGPGVAIAPREGRVVAPAAGTVVALPASAHAVGLRTDEGVELLIHVGIDTVKLAGEHFTPRVRQGQRVSRGELLLEFDTAAIQAAGYSLITPVVVTNLGTGQRVDVLAEGVVDEQAPLLRVHAGEA